MSDHGVTLWLIPFLPFLASIVVALLGPRVLRGGSHWPVWVALGMSFLYSLINLYQTNAQGELAIAYEWFRAGDLTVNMVLRSDALTSIMLVMVTLVALLVAIYSRSYVRGDPGYPRYFAAFSLFVASMTLLVLASNFVVLYMCW